jgi:hypothetical protein
MKRVERELERDTSFSLTMGYWHGCREGDAERVSLVFDAG